MVQIENMTVSDLDEISLTDFDDFWTYNTFKLELQNPNSKYIVARINEEIVGFAGIWDSSDDIHITNIVIKKSKRKLGIGKLLLEKLIEITNNRNLTLEVNENNVPAINLYTNYGFKKLGIRKNYYQGQNAIIMTRNNI